MHIRTAVAQHQFEVLAYVESQQFLLGQIDLFSGL